MLQSGLKWLRHRLVAVLTYPGILLSLLMWFCLSLFAPTALATALAKDQLLTPIAAPSLNSTPAETPLTLREPAPVQLAQANICANLDTSAYYRITPRHSGKAIDVYGGQTSNGAALIQWPYQGGANQQWQLKRLTDGYYTINARHSQKSADVTGASRDNGAKLIQWQNTNSDSQRWCFQPTGDGYYRILAKHSQKAIDVPGASQNNGVQLIQWQAHTGTNQQWQLTPVAAIPAVPSPATQGQWSSRIAFPSIPVAAALLPNGKVVTWSSFDRNTFVGNQGPQQTYTAIFDPQTNQVQENLVTNTNHDMFCPGTALLGDGRLLVNGGGPTVTTTSIFDGQTNQWNRSADMAQRRWYNTSVTLPNGEVFTLGGNRTSGLDGRGEIWNLTQGWRTLTGAIMTPFYSGNPLNRAEEHPHLIVAPNGKLFGAGPTPNLQWLDLGGSGSYQAAGQRGNDIFNQNGVYVMYDVGKVLSAGGNPNYDGANSETTASSSAAYTIDINNNQATVQQVPSMRYPRAYGNGVVLPDGKVLMVGGLNNGKAFSDNGAILAAEMFNPSTNSWSTMASMATPRTYHSVALLLPDGRVLAGGGGLCGSCSVNHADAEIYSPPYLFNGSRPTITSAPAAVGYSQNFTVQASSDVTEFTLVRSSSVTHSINTDQRFKRVSFTGSGGNYTLNLNSNANVTPPGYYMLFALNSRGVPSVSKIIRVG
ncbi:RICIN domain-containing protein [Alkalinema sp. FACHB-956]|uniref:RICIN domain-containing protein n=1 Tax=Alkalinema sp. FACHB-956 TaxID=2692768 RepID=UPI0016824FE4|nr:RICIN domain-containing protein [Alkalinema sp. FACHB-956]MBD2329576.1 RICIN domain-containing protein [Alkalinema sp. FACHB-956]